MIHVLLDEKRPRRKSVARTTSVAIARIAEATPERFTATPYCVEWVSCASPLHVRNFQLVLLLLRGSLCIPLPQPLGLHQELPNGGRRQRVFLPFTKANRKTTSRCTA